MKTLTIFYDARCGLCTKFRGWMQSQPLRVDVEFLDYQSDEAIRRFPKLRDLGADREVVVMADDGRWWQGAAAWVMCLWVTRDHIEWAHRFASPMMLPLVRKAVHLISENRLRLSELLRLRCDADLARRIRHTSDPDCQGGTCILPPPFPTTSSPHMS